MALYVLCILLGLDFINLPNGVINPAALFIIFLQWVLYGICNVFIFLGFLLFLTKKTSL